MSNIGTWSQANIDPRSFSTFEDKANCLKEFIKERMRQVLISFPVEFNHFIRQHCVLSGSSISSIYHSEEVKDYDIWFKDPAVLSEHIQAIESNYGDYIATYKDEPGYDSLRPGNLGGEKVSTHNAITFMEKLQLIKLGDYKTCRVGFDFIHCMPYYDLSDDKFYISGNQMNSIANKRLIRNPTGNTPVQWRIEKFRKRGWTGPY